MVKYTAEIYQSRGGVYSIREAADENSEDESETANQRINAVSQSETEDLKSVISYFEENEVFELGIKLESDGSRIDRVLVVSKLDEIHYLTGFDVNQSESNATIGSIMVLTQQSQLSLNGDGGLYVVGDPKEPQSTQILYKPISIQALWSLHMTLTRLISCSRSKLSSPRTEKSLSTSGSPLATSDRFFRFTNKKLTSPRHLINWWEFDKDLWSKRPDRFIDQSESMTENGPDMNICDNRYCVSRMCLNPFCKSIRSLIKINLQNIMSDIDVDIATSKQIHDRVGALMPEYDLTRYKKFIDNEMLTVLGEMENSSQILDFMFLGSEWNAANRSELIQNGITHILNITKEIDNFYPGQFCYKNILLFDVPESDLLQHWEDTYKFILNAAKSNGKVLIHCKMGISRSASTVCAFLMKYKSWGLKHALRFVKDKRPIVNPNDGFLSQLITYEGILNAIKNRYSFGHDHFEKGAGEQLNDSDIDLHNEIRVKKLVQFIHEREKAELRRSKSNSRSSKRGPVMTSESQNSHEFNHQVALLCSNNYSSSSSNDSFSPIQDTSFSSFTDLYESQGCYLDQSDGDDPDDITGLELRSFHKLQDAGLVRMRTRQIEARIRRKKSRRKKIRDISKLCQSHSAGSEVSLTNSCCETINRTRLFSDSQSLGSQYSKPCQQIYQTV